MDINQLYYFRTVARTENISKASDILFISQPNLSTSISRLEKSLGFALFDRDKGRIRLNYNGEMFLNCVERMLTEYESTLNTIRKASKYGAAHIKIGSALSGVIPKLMAEYTMRFGRIPTTQYEYPNERIEQQLLDGEINMAVLIQKPEAAEIEWTPLIEDRLVAVLAPANPMNCGRTASLETFAQCNFICNELYISQPVFKSLCGKAGFVPNIVRCSNIPEVLTPDTPDYGRNIAVYPLHMLPRLTNNGTVKLRTVLLSDHYAVLPVGLCRLKYVRHDIPQIDFFNFARETIAQWMGSEQRLGNSIHAALSQQ